ncbi:MAG: DNA polymerase III subunit delta [Halanaerobiaceae bacterium]
MNEVDKIINKEKSNLAGIYLVHSEESYLLDEFKNKFLKEFVPEDIRGFNLTFLDDGQLSAGRLKNAVSTLPVMADRRYVVVKTGEYFTGKSPEDERLSKLFKNFPSGAVLLILVEGKIDGRLSINKTVKKKGKVFQLQSPRNRELDTWIKQKFAAEGKNVEPRGVKLLEEMFNNKLQRLDSEISKIVTYCGEIKTISYEDIREVISRDRLLEENIIFDFTDALGEKRPDKALEILREMVKVGEEPFRILGNIVWQLKLLLQVKDLKDRGQSPKQIASRLGMHPYPVKKTYGRCANFSQAELERILERFLQANLEMTTGKYDEKQVPLEMAIMDI